MRRVPRIGLTGGIGSGKSVVTERFSALGVPVMDADKITRTLCMPGEPALAKIVATFGLGILDAEGRLDRAALRERIFIDPESRRNLEAILHPLVQVEMIRWSETLDAPYAILVIPLLLENRHLLDLIERVLVVDCPKELQIQRVMARDHVSRAWVEAVLSVQVTRNVRLEAADNVLVNDGDLNTLYQRIDEMHQYYLEWVR